MNNTKPKAITMWDFSWLERRWTGGGYEDWAKSLDELVERGYDAVRIDVYPHLLAEDPIGEWTLLPAWNQQCWGAPWVLKVERIKESIVTFISLCKERNIAVGLSSWYREDESRALMKVKTPDDLAPIW